MEVWREVAGHDGKYSVSSYGRVRNNLTGHIHTNREAGSGYLFVTLSKNGKEKNAYVHRLVAEQFLEQAGERTQVNHKDGNKRNNRIGNLEWVTPVENMRHALEAGLYCPFGKDRKPIVATNIETGEERWFESVRAAQQFYGTRHIGAVLKGKRNKAKGYTFRYANGGDAHAS